MAWTKQMKFGNILAESKVIQFQSTLIVSPKLTPNKAFEIALVRWMTDIGVIQTSGGDPTTPGSSYEIMDGQEIHHV